MLFKRLLALLLGLVLLGTLAGCGQIVPLNRVNLEKLKQQLEEIDQLPTIEAVKLKKEAFDTAKSSQDKNDPSLSQKLFLSAYCAERLGSYEEAILTYSALGRSNFGTMANFRIGEIAANASSRVMEADKQARGGYTRAAYGVQYESLRDLLPAGLKHLVQAPAHSQYAHPGGDILVRDPALASELPLKRWTLESLRIAANQRADKFQKESFSYQTIATLVRLTGNNPAYSCGLALIIIAVIVRVITAPLTRRQYKSMREMQALQPLLSELQKKHKDDKQKLMQEQMQLFKEHKINPMGGCLPMLVQLPFLYWVYGAVRAYSYPFEHSRFLWVSSLAMPDLALLLLYAVSLYFSQKITTPPTADPQQQQMQKMMALLMPVMLFMFLKNLPAAFVLYWFAQNVLMTVNQMLYLKKNPPPALQASAAFKQKKKKGN
jgi:YidC/Oxa1 family membrane protein insertase